MLMIPNRICVLRDLEQVDSYLIYSILPFLQDWQIAPFVLLPCLFPIVPGQFPFLHQTDPQVLHLAPGNPWPLQPEWGHEAIIFNPFLIYLILNYQDIETYTITISGMPIIQTKVYIL